MRVINRINDFFFFQPTFISFFLLRKISVIFRGIYYAEYYNGRVPGMIEKMGLRAKNEEEVGKEKKGDKKREETP